ncbi:MAG: lanthionine synthetase LanC family protein [Candidatus Electrothrix aestuarii]|uniref:Lanthionine synthetase LanC family protein n=1 Tax=Candidatus Electrothrix aestuarii TaxID=3062594 RepID=A0AAU8LPQ5_9BACT
MEPVNNKWINSYRSFGAELYSGTAGIALFLARLYAFTNDNLQKRVLEGAVNNSLNGFDNIEGFIRHAFYSGITGIAHSLIDIGEILGNEELIHKSIEGLTTLKNVELDPMGLDVISGSAGAIPALIDIAVRYKRDDILELAVMHGEHLLKHAQKSEKGTSWDTMRVENQKNLTGYSHGVSGIVVALLELYQKVNDKRFHEAALEGLRYERNLFSKEHGNWPDLRIMNPEKPSTEPAYNMAWCHGAPGIGIARLRIYFLLDKDPEVKKELESAIQTTITPLQYPVSQGQGNYSLCHGNCGNAELMLLSDDLLGKRPELRQVAEAVGLNGINQRGNQDLPWECGVMNAGEAPNLLLGIAGIGYYYLRLYDSKKVPSILIVLPN